MTSYHSYHSIPTFANSNMLTSFNALPNMNFQWSNDIVSSPESMGEVLFLKKLSMADRRQTF